MVTVRYERETAQIRLHLVVSPTPKLFSKALAGFMWIGPGLIWKVSLDPACFFEASTYRPKPLLAS